MDRLGHHVEPEGVYDHLVEVKRVCDNLVMSWTLRAELEINLAGSIWLDLFFA